MNVEEFAISTWIYESEPTESALHKIAAVGFRQVELWANEAHLDPRVKPDIQGTATALSGVGLHVHSVHAPFHGMRIGSSDPAEIRETEDCLIRTLEYTVRLGSQIMVVHPLTFNHSTGSGTSIEASRDLISRLVDLAAEDGVMIAVENLPTAPPAYTSLQKLSQLFPDPRIGLCIDIGHTHLNHLQIPEEIEAAGYRLISSHISNNDGKRDLHSLPQDGEIQVRPALAQLAAANVTPVFEVNGSGQPDRILARIIEYLKEHE